MEPTVGQKPYKLRLPRIGENVEDVQKIFYRAVTEGTGMSDEEIERIALGSPARYGEYLIHASDPEWTAAIHRWYNEMFGLVAGLGPHPSVEDTTYFMRSSNKESPDYERWALMQLWLYHVHLKNEYARVLITEGTPHGTSITHEKIFLLDFPDSDIWNEDERLVLKFVDATFNFKMTDELFQAAVEAWGPKTIMRCIGLLMYYYMMALLFEATGHDRFINLDPSRPWSEQTGWSHDVTEGNRD